MSRPPWKITTCLFTWNSSTMADSWSNRLCMGQYARSPKSFVLWHEIFNNEGSETPALMDGLSNGEEFIEAFRYIIDMAADAERVTLTKVLSSIISLALQPTFLTPLMPISEELSAYIGSEGW